MATADMSRSSRLRMIRAQAAELQGYDVSDAGAVRLVN